MIKRFMAAVLLGVGMELGTHLVKEGVELARDPHKRAVIKTKANRIKDAIFKKEVEA